MQATAYVRVSSKSQTDGMQRTAIERAAAARADVIASWYAEKKSARTLARAQLDKLRADARAGHVRRLYVYRLDRLARSGIRDTFELVEELRACGVEIVTVSDGFSLDGPAAEVILAVMAWAAKMERLAINERIAAARLRVEAQGGKWGRPPSLTDVVRAKVIALHKDGRSLTEIASATGTPRSTVQRVIAARQPVES